MRKIVAVLAMSSALMVVPRCSASPAYAGTRWTVVSEADKVALQELALLPIEVQKWLYGVHQLEVKHGWSFEHASSVLASFVNDMKPKYDMADSSIGWDQEQIKQFIYKTFGNGWASSYLINEVIPCESSWNRFSNAVTWKENSKGLTQINVGPQGGFSWFPYLQETIGLPDKDSLYQPYWSILATKAIFDYSGDSFKEWTCN
jgi:hypothetical protein